MAYAWKEREDLNEIDRKISEVSKCIADQLALIDRLAREGQASAEAEDLLQVHRQALRAWRERRLLILEEIARQDEPEL